jgi:hypothetical protein
LLVGEIGIPRREFLYDIRFWEVRRIIKGYRRRNILHYQLQRMNVWASMFCMGNPKNKRPQDIFPLFFDDDDEERDDETDYTDDEVAALQAEMDAINSEAGTD